ncbi:periplasmic heavy metal sensor [bacterium]|nr:periplasmic heavy metal sensor [bacterium]MBU1936230.1 periplasmic heavy metal sensor [bacterium]
MTTCLKFIMILSVSAGITCSQSLFAQDPSQDRLRDRVETVIIGKFSESLNLSPEQAEKFFPQLRLYQRNMEEIQREQRTLRQQLDQLSDSEDSSPEEVAQLLDRFSANQQRMVEHKRRFLGEVSPFMSPQQVSRCSILMDEIPHRVREMIRERREFNRNERAEPRRAPPRQSSPRRRGR